MRRKIATTAQTESERIRVEMTAILPDGRVVSMKSPEWHEFVRAQVATAPPLTAEQKAKLWVLLAPMRARLRERAEARLAAELAAGVHHEGRAT